MTAIIASVLVGRHHGLRHKPHVVSTISYIFIVVWAVYVIIDPNHPTGGLIRVSQEAMQRLAKSIRSSQGPLVESRQVNDRDQNAQNVCGRDADLRILLIVCKAERRSR